MRLRIYCEIDAGGIDPSLVKRSLDPDNIEVPEGMSLEVMCSDNRVSIYAECDIDKMLTCRSTVDEILMLIDSIIKSLKKPTTQS